MTDVERNSGRGWLPAGLVSTWRSCLVLVLGAVASFALVFFGLTRSPALLTVALVLATKAAVDARAEGTAATSLRVSTALACAFAAGVLGFDLWTRLPRTPVPPSLNPIDNVFQFAGTLVSLSLVLLAFGAGLLITSLFFWLTKWQARAGVLRYGGVLATSLLAALSLLGAVRAVTRPTVEWQLMGMMSRSETPSPPPGCRRSVGGSTPRQDTVRAEGDLVVLSRCVAFASCSIGVFASDSRPAAGERADLPFTVPDCSALEVTRLSPDLVLLRAAFQESRFYDSAVTQDALFRRRGDRWVISYDEDLVAGKAGPPRSWVACGMVGLALAIAAWRRRAQARRRWRSQEHAEPPQPFSADIVSGPDAEEITRWEAWALAISCLAAAPLAAAAMAGLVF